MTIEPARPFLLLLKTHVKRLLIACFTGLWCLHATAAPTSAPVRAEIEALLTKLQAAPFMVGRPAVIVAMLNLRRCSTVQVMAVVSVWYAAGAAIHSKSGARQSRGRYAAEKSARATV